MNAFDFKFDAADFDKKIECSVMENAFDYFRVSSMARLLVYHQSLHRVVRLLTGWIIYHLCCQSQVLYVFWKIWYSSIFHQTVASEESSGIDFPYEHHLECIADDCAQNICLRKWPSARQINLKVILALIIRSGGFPFWIDRLCIF